jgi:hypothetical protein
LNEGTQEEDDGVDELELDDEEDVEELVLKLELNVDEDEEEVLENSLEVEEELLELLENPVEDRKVLDELNVDVDVDEISLELAEEEVLEISVDVLELEIVDISLDADVIEVSSEMKEAILETKLVELRLLDKLIVEVSEHREILYA